MAITLSLLSKDASNVPSFTFLLRVQRQTICCSETFILEVLCFTVLALLMNRDTVISRASFH